MVLMRLPSGQQWRKRPVDTVGGEAKAGETYGESNTEIYISQMTSINYIELASFLHNSFLKF